MAESCLPRSHSLCRRIFCLLLFQTPVRKEGTRKNRVMRPKNVYNLLEMEAFKGASYLYFTLLPIRSIFRTLQDLGCGRF
ncbi:hypothetical protein MRB53_025304 [Persea americana]|uniref:Uncharacterized protein n=1 Tax=Persea americana TaxID=3435 RepID=A0ACC2LFJ2_PERAE|nr:hypothetical protein MRB53_025304 [Persea americana]